MEPADFGKHRKALLGTSAIGFVIAATGAQEFRWAEVVLGGAWMWIFLGIAHAYFMLMFWVCFGLKIIDNQNFSSTISYAGPRRDKIGHTFTYSIPLVLGWFGAANIAVHLLMILENWMKVG